MLRLHVCSHSTHACACSSCFRTAFPCIHSPVFACAHSHLHIVSIPVPIHSHTFPNLYVPQDLGTVEALLISALELSEAAAGCVEGDEGVDLEDLPPRQQKQQHTITPSLGADIQQQQTAVSTTGAASCEPAQEGATPVPLLGLEATTRAALSKLCILLCQEVRCLDSCQDRVPDRVLDRVPDRVPGGKLLRGGGGDQGSHHSP